MVVHWVGMLVDKSDELLADSMVDLKVLQSVVHWVVMMVDKLEDLLVD